MLMGSESLVWRWFGFELYRNPLPDGVLSSPTPWCYWVVIYHFLAAHVADHTQKKHRNAHTFKPFLDAG
jgi:hypothetical protein